jgi:hypothetical protein
MNWVYKIIILVTFFLLSMSCYIRLSYHPLAIFILRADGVTVEAFRIQLFLNNHESLVETIKFNFLQEKRGKDILELENIKALRSFSEEFGKYDIVVGTSGNKPEDPWPWYIGGGWKCLFQSPLNSSFDDSSWFDRIYLALETQTPPSPPFFSSESKENYLDNTSVKKFVTASVATISASPTSSAGTVRVEILNGCGITNAADWVARRLKGLGIIITYTGNADNFHYPKTIIRTSIGVPVILEETMDRLGLSKDSVQEVSALTDSTDVAVIVGKDFLKLKEQKRDRRHH